MKKGWIYCSLFSEQSNWAFIIKEGISLILVKLSSIDSFRVRFDYTHGPNIQVAILTNQNECAKVAEQIDLLFKLFFSHSKLYEKPSILPRDTLFIPFPQNTIHYGLYELNPKVEEDENDLRRLLSEIILISLAEDLDDTSILTLGLYLHLSIIKVYNQLPNHRFEALHVRFLEIYPTNPLNVGKRKGFVKANKNILIGIFEDVLVKEFEESHGLFWLTRWQKYLRYKIEKNQTTSDEDYQISIANTVNDFLGLNLEAVQLLNSLIHKTIYFGQRCSIYENI